MPNRDGLTVLYQHLISPEVSSGEPGAIKWPLILTVTKGDGQYAVWLTRASALRRVYRTPSDHVARHIYDQIKAMPYQMAMQHWIEAACNDY